MNSLNILTRTSSGSIATLGLSNPSSREKSDDDVDYDQVKAEADSQQGGDGHEHVTFDEKTPLLESKDKVKRPSWKIHRRIAEIVVNSIKVVIATITAPGKYIVACFYDEDGHFSSLMPLRRIGSTFGRQRRRTAPPHAALSQADPPVRHHRRQPSNSSIASTTSSLSDEDPDQEGGKHSRTHSLREPIRSSEGNENRRSIRIQVQEEALRRRRGPRDPNKRYSGANPEDVATVASALKSPSSPTVNKTKYPRSPVPPRPLVPRRQPSYSLGFSNDSPKKVLIIDLDETLIHSMAKGGRMSQGHMVEVRLGGPVTTSGVSIGAGVPILYFVHERPGCHEFLKKVCKWYELVIFTASVQEYADPVIDWLERERKYFSRRYYRQHCTYRNGAYIKDLAQVEPDLSKVMILDNSPMSYVFHEDNAIPIEGWISDPTDTDLLHLIPLLEGLQYVIDVRALLALRQGQAPQA